MTKEDDKYSSALLDPVARVAEILFGLIMVLTFTCSLSAATAGREDIREMLIGALCCNVAWGIIDALLFLMATYTERARGRLLLSKLKAMSDPVAGRALIADAMPQKLAEHSETDHLEHLRKKLVGLDTSNIRTNLTKQDFRAAFLIFGLVFLSIFLVAIPFLVMQQAQAALRVSNCIAVVMMIAAGASLGRYTGGRPMIWGIIVAIFGIAVVLLTIALGG